MNTNTERLKKLYALALRGVDGEKEQATAILNRLIKKYGISLNELNEDIIKTYDFTFHGKVEEKLLRQITYKVTNETNHFHSLQYVDSGRKCRTQCQIDCTEAQKIEIEFLFDFHKKLWEREAESLLFAYIQKHRLYGELKDGEEGEKCSPEKLEKLCAMMNGLSNETPVVQITDKNN